MKSASPIHFARQHQTCRPGIEATTITSNRHFPRHAHDNYGIGLFDRGAHRSWSSIGDVESGAGDIVSVNPEEMHDGVPLAEAPRSWRMIYFDREIVDRHVGEEAARPFEFARPVFRDPSLRAQLEMFFSLLVSPEHETLAVEEAVARLLLTVFDRHSAERSPTRGATPAARRARQLIDGEPAAAISLQALADAECVSRFQLIRAFAKEVGVTPYAYQMQRRVRLARRRVADGTPLAEAAAAAGFADQSHMTRAFVRQFGVTPARYQDAIGIGRNRRRNIIQDE